VSGGGGSGGGELSPEKFHHTLTRREEKKVENASNSHSFQQFNIFFLTILNFCRGTGCVLLAMATFSIL
jgi:hypothetical protein